jgi:hypothetical protein
VGASSNGQLMSSGPSLLWGLVATARVSRAPTVVTGEVHPLILGHHISDGTTSVGHLPIAMEGDGDRWYSDIL